MLRNGAMSPGPHLQAPKKRATDTALTHDRDMQTSAPHSHCIRLKQEPRALIVAAVCLGAEHRRSLVVVHLIVNVKVGNGPTTLNAVASLEHACASLERCIERELAPLWAPLDLKKRCLRLRSSQRNPKKRCLQPRILFS